MIVGSCRIPRVLRRMFSPHPRGAAVKKMGLAPSRNDENPGKSAVAKVPVPIFSQLRGGCSIGLGMICLAKGTSMHVSFLDGLL
jgi:hypothetical protein